MNAHLNEVQRGREGMEPEEMEQLLQKILQDFRNTSSLHSGLNYDQIKSRLMPFTLDEPGGIDAVVKAIDAYLDTSVNTGHPGFLRAFWGPSEPASIVASLLTDVRNTTMHSFAVAPSATIIETEMIKAISDLAGFPGHGIFTTGGSNSNEMGFLCAREDALPGSSVNGFSGQNLRAFSSLEAHYSVKGRAGTAVIIIKGFSGLKKEDLKNLAKPIKNKLGIGGSIKKNEILIATKI